MRDFGTMVTETRCTLAKDSSLSFLIVSTGGAGARQPALHRRTSDQRNGRGAYRDILLTDTMKFQGHRDDSRKRTHQIEQDVGKELRVTSRLTTQSARLAGVLRRFAGLEENVIEV